MSFPLSKLGVSFVAVLKKSKKRQAKTLLLKIRSTPIALAALPVVFFAPRFLPYVTAAVPPLCHFRSENLHFVRGCPKKVEKTSSENTTFENSEHPYRTCGSSADFSIFSYVSFSLKSQGFSEVLLKSLMLLSLIHI